jgi:methionyl-tRNA synthetase
MEQLRVADAISEIFALFKRCNKYIDETAPWVLAKSDETKDRLAQVLYNLVESIAVGAELLEPFMPETSQKILAQLNTGKRGLDHMDQFGLYPSGNRVTDKPEILFMRQKLEDVMEEVARRHPAPAEQAPAAEGDGEKAEEKDYMDPEQKPEISIDDFSKLQIQVGEILKCEAVKKSKKLLCSQVRIGSQTRQILSGIRQFYSAEEMVGKKVLVVTNLKPAKLAGLMSEGMILAAEDDEGRLSLITTEKEMKTGAEVH